MSTLPKLLLDLPKFAGPFDAHKLVASGCDVLFASYPAGTTITMHSHETENVGIITKGELALTMNGETKTFKVGDWYHVPAMAPHSAFFESESSEIEFWFHSK